MNRDITVIWQNLWKKSEWQGAFLLNLTFRGIGECSAIYFRYKKAPHIGEANIIYCLLSVSL